MSDRFVPTPEDTDRIKGAKKIGDAGRQLIDAGNAAAQARLTHEQAIAHPKGVDMFAVAQARRQAEAEAQRKLEKYIDTVLNHAPRGE